MSNPEITIYKILSTLKFNIIIPIMELIVGIIPLVKGKISTYSRLLLNSGRLNIYRRTCIRNITICHLLTFCKQDALRTPVRFLCFLIDSFGIRNPLQNNKMYFGLIENFNKGLGL